MTPITHIALVHINNHMHTREIHVRTISAAPDLLEYIHPEDTIYSLRADDVISAEAVQLRIAAQSQLRIAAQFLAGLFKRI